MESRVFLLKNYLQVENQSVFPKATLNSISNFKRLLYSNNKISSFLAAVSSTTLGT